MNPVTQALQYGTYYPQAWHHYGNPTIDVTCSCCRRNRLRACIGFRETVLCLRCAAEKSELHFPDDVYGQQEHTQGHTRGFPMTPIAFNSPAFGSLGSAMLPHPPLYPPSSQTGSTAVHSKPPWVSDTS